MSLPRTLQPRAFGALNSIGLWTLFWRCVSRFLKEAVETIGGPMVSGGLFLGVFAVAYTPGTILEGGLLPVTFVAPGIIIFALAHSAFEFGAVPLLYDKLEGMIGDIVSAPLSAGEMMLGYVLGAAVVGLIVGCAVFLTLTPFAGFSFAAPQISLLFAMLTAVLFGLIGVLAGLWADRWEHYAATDTFMILPLGFLSGAFFPTTSLPDLAAMAIRLNPVFYLVDGFRYGLIGKSESNLLVGFLVLVGVITFLAWLCARLFRLGYKIKA
ncbi:ABC transporter permease [Limibacillus sp. MBR-115]|jgi:ABC-2 type transport system permease protein|uniref:ABC transporter permease n=1 Tax=Limibacillus sp. MBR-115 TaxID=3156465 RepID=UPI0033984527